MWKFLAAVAALVSVTAPTIATAVPSATVSPIVIATAPAASYSVLTMPALGMCMMLALNADGTITYVTINVNRREFIMGVGHPEWLFESARRYRFQIRSGDTLIDDRGLGVVEEGFVGVAMKLDPEDVVALAKGGDVTIRSGQTLLAHLDGAEFTENVNTLVDCGFETRHVNIWDELEKGQWSFPYEAVE